MSSLSPNEWGRPLSDRPTEEAELNRQAEQARQLHDGAVERRSFAQRVLSRLGLAGRHRDSADD